MHREGVRVKLSAVASAGVLFLLAAGCIRNSEDTTAAATLPVAGAPATDDYYRVTADTTSFYRYGPQQPSGPDLALKKDTRVAMLKRAFGYSQIRTPDNQIGYVGTADIAPLSAAELASERAAQSAALNPQKRSSAIVGEYTIPPEAGNRERLPEPEVKATPPAAFRY